MVTYTIVYLCSYALPPSVTFHFFCVCLQNWTKVRAWYSFRPRHTLMCVRPDIKCSLFLFSKIDFHVEIEKKQQNRTIEHRVEDPSSDSITPAVVKVQQEHAEMADQVATQ